MLGENMRKKIETYLLAEFRDVGKQLCALRFAYSDIHMA